LKIGGKEKDCVDIAGIGFCGDEAAIDQKAVGTDLFGKVNPAAETKHQTPSMWRDGTETESDLGFIGKMKPIGQIAIGSEWGNHRNGLYMAAWFGSISLL
jgi:hypothetical protein